MSEQSPEVFALSPAYFQRLKRTILWTMIVILPGSIALGVLPHRRNPADGGTTIFSVALVVGIVAGAMYFSLKKQIARWRTFRITMSSDQMLRTQEGHDDVSVAASSISRMVRIPGRGLLIYAGQARPAITIPDTLERFEDCCNLAQRFRPIEVRTGAQFPRWLVFPAAFAVMGVYYGFERSADPRVIYGLGVVLAVAVGVGAWRMSGSSDFDTRTRKRVALALVFVILTIGTRIWSTWNAPRRIEREIQDNHLLSLLVKANPGLHDRLRDAMAVAERNRTESGGGAYVNPTANVLSEALPQFLPVCSDEAIINYTKETVTVLERLEADPSDICYEWTHSHGVHVDVLSVLGKDGLEPVMKAMEAAVESALTSPQAPPDSAEAETLRKQAMAKVTPEEWDGPVELHPPEPPGTDKKVWCHKAVVGYKAILNLPSKHSSLVLRHLYSK
jgi:hypothetical protein